MILRTIHNYVIKEQIGQGGMGAVYLAEDARIGRRVAIKVLLPATSAQPELVRRFFNEAKAATEIRNPHIVDVIDFGELEDGTSYIIMEWLEGRSLAQALTQDGRFNIPRAVHVARGIGRALSAAHERESIVHRDSSSPDNIFLVRHDDDADFVKVLRLRHRQALHARRRQRACTRWRARSWARRTSCRPSSARASPSMRAPTCTRWA